MTFENRSKYKTAIAFHNITVFTIFVEMDATLVI